MYVFIHMYVFKDMKARFRNKLRIYLINSVDIYCFQVGVFFSKRLIFMYF